MTSQWIRAGPTPLPVSFLEERPGTDTAHTEGRRPCEADAEINAMHLQAQDGWQPPEAKRLAGALQKEPTLPTVWGSGFWPPDNEN